MVLLQKKAQTWMFDFFVGFLIFLGLLFLGLGLLRNVDNDSDFFDVKKESERVSSILLSEGFPSNWNSSLVTSPGLLSEHRINVSKLEEFDSLQYDKVKSLMSVHNNFVFYFENTSGIMNVSGKCFRGYDFSGCDVFDFNYENLAKTERIVILNSKIILMVVLSWN
jgi:hypothetical protein